MEVVYHNHLELKKFIETEIPVIKVIELQGTYLQWMDFQGIGLNRHELEELLHKEAEVFFD